ncbi:DUF3299 domain-containing protein [Curvibacter sp. CHRR-16]|nr:DUF3299 domain-containing protein [Curvibacter sp. CHRR-16]
MVLGVTFMLGSTSGDAQAQSSAANATAGAGAGGANAAPAAVGDATRLGSGAGVYSQHSLFPALKERNDVLPWSLLTAVKTKRIKNRLLPVFPDDIQYLDSKTLRVQGYMMPLEPGEKQTHFLVSSVPLTCPFCLPGGPESMIEVKMDRGIKYTMAPVVVEGQFAVLEDDPYGLYYRMTGAKAVD